MARPRLTDEERKARRKARSAYTFSDARFKNRYDPKKEGYGSAEQWIAAAEALINGTILRVGTKRTGNPDLELLGVDELPETMEALKKAYRNAMFIHHPDYGGDVETAKQVNLAFERLGKNYV
jgi:hypothetical protein